MSKVTKRPEVSKLSVTERDAALASLTGWVVNDEKLYKSYRFADFVQAFGFMSMAALRIEKMNHHPEWSNVYQTVEVSLTTHDADGISIKDFELARILDEVAAKLQ